MPTADDLINLLDENEEPENGAGLYPLKPTMMDGVVALSPTEGVLGSWRVTNLAATDEGRADGFQADVTLTNHRLIFQVLNWRSSVGLMDRITAMVGERTFNERWVMAGHLHLEGIADVGNGVGRSSVVTVSAVGQFKGTGVKKVTLSWRDSDAGVRDFVRMTVEATKQRWREHTEVSDDLMNQILDMEPTTDVIGGFRTGKMQTLDYRIPVALILNTAAAFSPTHAFDDHLSVTPIRGGDESATSSKAPTSQPTMQADSGKVSSTDAVLRQPSSPPDPRAQELGTTAPDTSEVIGMLSDGDGATFDQLAEALAISHQEVSERLKELEGVVEIVRLRGGKYRIQR